MGGRENTVRSTRLPQCLLYLPPLTQEEKRGKKKRGKEEEKAGVVGPFFFLFLRTPFIIFLGDGKRNKRGDEGRKKEGGRRKALPPTFSQRDHFFHHLSRIGKEKEREKKGGRADPSCFFQGALLPCLRLGELQRDRKARKREGERGREKRGVTRAAISGGVP